MSTEEITVNLLEITDIDDIDSIMQNQEESWNRGDIPSFMNGYWKNDSLSFISRRGLTKGFNATLENYFGSYPDTTSMGRLEFNNQEILRIEDHHALVIGSWTLFRTADTLTGMYSLTWRWNKERGWEIIADHSS